MTLPALRAPTAMTASQISEDALQPDTCRPVHAPDGRSGLVPRKRAVDRLKTRVLAGLRWSALLAGLAGSPAWAQGQVVALCSTDQGWCELAAREFTRSTGIKVLQVRKATGEALAQLKAESANPKTDLWWGGTGDPFLQAAEDGLLEPYRPRYINDLQAWSVRQYATSGNMVGGFYTSAIGFGYNEEVLRKKKLPPPRCWPT